jgi:hypothetical protein
MTYFVLGKHLGLKPREVDLLPRKMVEVFLILAEKAAGALDE